MTPEEFVIYARGVLDAASGPLTVEQSESLRQALRSVKAPKPWAPGEGLARLREQRYSPIEETK